MSLVLQLLWGFQGFGVPTTDLARGVDGSEGTLECGRKGDRAPRSSGVLTVAVNRQGMGSSEACFNTSYRRHRSCSHCQAKIGSKTPGRVCMRLSFKAAALVTLGSHVPAHHPRPPCICAPRR